MGVTRSDPVVSYRETVAIESTRQILGKSPNKHNRFLITAEPFKDGLCEAIEENRITPNQDMKTRARLLASDFEWDVEEARKIWSFGPLGKGPNTFVDISKGIQYLSEIKDSAISAFQNYTLESVLTDEELRGVRFNLHDATLHTDAIHRGGGQVIPTIKKCLAGSVLIAQPRLMEPFFLVEIQGPSSCIGGVYSCLNTRRGEIISEESTGVRVLIKAYMPVAESFKFSEHLRSLTSGEAFPQCVFDHWALNPNDPLEVDSKCYKIVKEIRKRKGLKDEFPVVGDFEDKL